MFSRCNDWLSVSAVSNVLSQQLLIILAHCSAVSEQAEATALLGIAMSDLRNSKTKTSVCASNRTIHL